VNSDFRLIGFKYGIVLHGKGRKKQKKTDSPVETIGESAGNDSKKQREAFASLCRLAAY
jgi:hypothetical protein